MTQPDPISFCSPHPPRPCNPQPDQSDRTVRGVIHPQRTQLAAHPPLPPPPQPTHTDRGPIAPGLSVQGSNSKCVPRTSNGPQFTIPALKDRIPLTAAPPQPLGCKRSSSPQAFLFPATPPPPQASTTPSPALGAHPAKSLQSSFLFPPHPQRSHLPFLLATPSSLHSLSKPASHLAERISSSEVCASPPPHHFFLQPISCCPVYNLRPLTPRLQTQPQHGFKPSMQPPSSEPKAWLRTPQSSKASPPPPGSLRPAAVPPPSTPASQYDRATWRGPRARPTSAALR